MTNAPGSPIHMVTAREAIRVMQEEGLNDLLITRSMLAGILLAFAKPIGVYTWEETVLADKTAIEIIHMMADLDWQHPLYPKGRTYS